MEDDNGDPTRGRPSIPPTVPTGQYEGHVVHTIVAMIAIAPDGSQGLMATRTTHGWTPLLGTEPHAVATVKAKGAELAPATGSARVVARTFTSNGERFGDEVVWEAGRG